MEDERTETLPDDGAEDYYRVCLDNYPAINNVAAIAEWFAPTEPTDGRPKHTRVLHVKVAESIAQNFLNRITAHVIFSGQYYHPEAGFKLPAKEALIQPLAHGPIERFTHTLYE